MPKFASVGYQIFDSSGFCDDHFGGHISSVAPTSPFISYNNLPSQLIPQQLVLVRCQICVVTPNCCTRVARRKPLPEVENAADVCPPHHHNPHYIKISSALCCFHHIASADLIISPFGPHFKALADPQVYPNLTLHTPHEFPSPPCKAG